MKRFILVMGLLCAVAFPCYAQNWTPQDSLRLNRLLKGEGEVKLNPEVLQELEMNNSLGTAANRPQQKKSAQQYGTRFHVFLHIVYCISRCIAS